MKERAEGGPPGPPSSNATTVSQAPTAAAAPRLAEGTTLIGQQEGSGLKEAPYLVKRADGQMVTLPPLLYALAEELDGSPVAAVAERVGARVQRQIDPDDLSYLISEKLAPLGLVDGAGDGDRNALDPMLALNLRTKVVSPKIVRGVSATFAPLFFPPVIVVALIAVLVADAWVFFNHGVAQSVRQTVYEPLLMLGLFGAVVISAAFHEIGHAAACRYGGAEPGEMGVGLYVVWPAFYTDVTDSYRLGKGGRIRTDLGGVYFNTLIILATVGAYLATGFEPLLLLVIFQHFEIIRQLLPIFRLDGYYLLSDVTGIPDLFGRIGPILRSLVPWKKTESAVGELKTWSRVVVTVWILTVIPLMVLQLTLIVVHAPRILATAWDSMSKLGSEVSSSFGAGEPAAATMNIVRILLLALPIAAAVYTTTRIAKKAVGGAIRKTAERPVARGLVFIGVAGVIAFLVMSWLPEESYRPIGPRERWTLPESVRAVSATVTRRAPVAPTAAAADEPPAAEGSDQQGGTPATGAQEPSPSPATTATPSPAATTSPSPSPSTSPSPTP